MLQAIRDGPPRSPPWLKLDGRNNPRAPQELPANACHGAILAAGPKGSLPASAAIHLLVWCGTTSNALPANSQRKTSRRKSPSRQCRYLLCQFLRHAPGSHQLLAPCPPLRRAVRPFAEAQRQRCLLKGAVSQGGVPRAKSPRHIHNKARAHACTHTHTHTYIHTYIHACMQEVLKPLQ